MDEEQQDPAAELRSEIDEAFRPLAEFTRTFIDALAKAAQDPRVRAYIEACKRGEIPAPEPRRPCYCLCGKTHPGEYVCDGESVTTCRFVTELLGPVDVQLCAPCAVAQGLAELERS